MKGLSELLFVSFLSWDLHSTDRQSRNTCCKNPCDKNPCRKKSLPNRFLHKNYYQNKIPANKNPCRKKYLQKKYLQEENTCGWKSLQYTPRNWVLRRVKFSVEFTLNRICWSIYALGGYYQNTNVRIKISFLASVLIWRREMNWCREGAARHNHKSYQLSGIKAQAWGQSWYSSRRCWPYLSYCWWYSGNGFIDKKVGTYLIFNRLTKWLQCRW